MVPGTMPSARPWAPPDDTEADGIHSATADADGSDEDGVVDTGDDIVVGQTGAGVTINVQNAPSGAKLDAWMDFNQDGDWDDAGEQIFTNTAVVNGDNALTFDVPVTAAVGTTYARLRLSTAGGLSVTGSADDGEVEDHEVEITAAEELVFDFGTGDNVIVFSDNGISDDNIFRITSTNPNETYEYTSPSASLKINAGDGADVITLQEFETGSFAIVINTEGGNDTVDASAIDVAVKVNGSGGNDTLTGGSANDTLNGGSGEDKLVGGPGNDKLQGQGSSYDTLTGGEGDDTLDGGDGYDRIFETADVNFTATDTSLTGLGSDTLNNIQLVQLFGGSSANTIDASAFTGRAFLNGSGGNDTLTGGGWYDRIFGGSGRDLITGGTSVIDPGTGGFTYDVLRGQGGNNDTLIGGDGNDKLNGGIGHDSLVGGDGDDVLTGESGNDTIAGGAGNDRLYERGNVDLTLSDSGLSGDLGTNVIASIETAYLKGGNGNNLLDASSFTGDVTIIGVGGDDTLKGGSGNDMLNGRSGADLITGGDGDDTLLGMRDADTLNGGAGDDSIDGGTQADRLSGWTGDDELYGRSGNDTLVGGDGNDILFGSADDDILQGDDGKADTDHTRDDDRLDGGDGTDTVRGGGGNDTLVGGDGDESFVYWDDWVDEV